MRSGEVRPVDFLIVGGGPAGFTCAKRLREDRPDASIVVVSRDPDLPYDRTACSKGYLRGEQSREETLLAQPGWWEEQGIELLSRVSAMKLDPGEQAVTFSNKETVRYGALLLATGANVRRLRVDGAQLDGIHYLRALGNADAIRRDAAEAERVVLVGGSYIACEVAASLTALGVSCALVMQEQVTLERGFGQRAGRFFQDVLEAHGVTVHAGEDVERFEGDGRVQAVITASGKRIEGDAVVVGAGVVPDVMLAQRAGLDIGERGGVLADSRLRTSAPGVYVAGDMCEYESVLHGGARLRVEHWDVAEQQGATVARAMLGATEPHAAVPYFFADLADWASLEYVGPAARWDEEIVRGAMEDGAFSVLYLDGGRLAAALSVGREDDLHAAQELLGTDLSDRRAELADADTPLNPGR
jgi:3-phenylpropionate/trans-cinnamate dioxygenase ferredoxin reductase component